MATRKSRGGGCACQRAGAVPNWLKNAIGTTETMVTDIEAKRQLKGGYVATKRDKYYLSKYKKGESIGFTMKASLKAKGLLPRTSKTMKGKKVVSNKYRHVLITK